MIKKDNSRYKKGVIHEELTTIIGLLLDLFTENTGYVVVLYDSDGNEKWCAFEQNFSPLCNYLKHNPQLWKLCCMDHVNRASINNFKNKVRKKEQICHLGLWNISYPLFVEDSFYGALLTGQKLILKNNYIALSEDKFTARLKELRALNLIDNEIEITLKEKFEKVDKIDSFPSHILDKLSAFEGRLIEIIQSLMHRIRTITLLRHEVHDPNIIVRGTLIIALEEAKNMKRILPAQYQGTICNIVDNIEHGIRNSKLFSAIIENISSSLGRESLNIKIGKCNIISLLESAIDIFKPPAGEKDIIFIKRISPRLQVRHIYGDYSLLMRAFINIYHNAVKYSYWGQSHEEPRKINTNCDDIGKYIQITVDNYGVGILRKEMADVWKEGYRGILSRDRHRTGSGLGLYQIKQIILAHKGRVNIDSIPLTDDPWNGPYLTKIIVELPFTTD